MVTRILIIFALFAACLTRAADFALPSDLQGWWTPHTPEPTPGSTPGVGVPDGFERFTAGGAEDRAVFGTVRNVTDSPYNADPTGGADATSAIQAAITASASGDLVWVPAGSYKIAGTVTIPYNKNITLRGAGRALTQFVATGSNTQKVFVVGSGGNTWTSNSLQTVSGTKTKGVTSLTVPSSALFTTNVPATIYMSNESDPVRIEAGAYPTFNSSAGDNLRNWLVMITGKPDSTTIQIDPPLLIDSTDYTLYAEPADAVSGFSLANSGARYVGFESFSLVSGDGVNYLFGIEFNRPLYCWAYDLEFNYTNDASNGACINWTPGFRNEVRHCTFIASPNIDDQSFSDGAIEYGGNTSMLIEDNAFTSPMPTWGWDVGIYSDGSVSNSVHAYNFFEKDVKNISINHSGGHGLMCLYEGNFGQRVQADGYNASTSHHTFYGNWWAGTSAAGSDPWRVSWYNRFSRRFALVKEVWGWDGFSSTTLRRPTFGLPNLGNDNYTGTAQPTLGDFWADFGLTGTLSESTGGTTRTVTASGGDWVSTTGAAARRLTVKWSGGSRRTMTIELPITGNTLIVSGGSGTELPLEATTLTLVQVDKAGWQELDLDVEPSFLQINNFVSGGTAGGGAIENTSTDTFPASLFRASKPDWFGDKPWPIWTISATGSPTYDWTALPAGHRGMLGNTSYLDGPSGGTAIISTLNVTGSLNIAAP
jgi:hypothetical protein